MQNSHNADLSELFDLLGLHTANYTAMLRNGATQEEFDACKKEIERIQKEIGERKPVSSLNTDISTNNISFS